MDLRCISIEVHTESRTNQMVVEDGTYNPYSLLDSFRVLYFQLQHQEGGADLGTPALWHLMDEE